MNELNHTASLLRRLAMGRSQTGLEAVAHAPDLSAGHNDISLERLTTLLDKNLADVPEVEISHTDFKRQLLDHAQQGLTALSKGEALNPKMMMGLEAIIIANGSRPAVLVKEGRVDLDDPTLGAWRADASRDAVQISTVSKSVARISQTVSGEMRPIGTAFMVARGLVVTNRHVLEAMATFDETKSAADMTQCWTFKDGLCVDFGAEYGGSEDPAKRFVPLAVRFCGSDPINGKVDVTKLDMVLIELKQESNKPFPKPLVLMPVADLWRPDMSLYAMGFPAKPSRGYEFDHVLDKLYGGVFDVKRWSPGKIQLMPGSVVDDAMKHCFTHDCSTLGGNSGGCIVDLAGDGSVVGLHIGGKQRTMNYAHVIRVVTEALNG